MSTDAPKPRQGPVPDPADLLMIVEVDQSNTDVVFTLANPDDELDWQSHWLQVPTDEVISLEDMR